MSCIYLPDLSAAFDTIDHSILLTRLASWFGFHESLLNWFKSYLDLDLSVLSVTVPSLPLVSPRVVFLRVLFSVRFYSSCARHHSVLSFLANVNVSSRSL